MDGDSTRRGRLDARRSVPRRGRSAPRAPTPSSRAGRRICRRST